MLTDKCRLRPKCEGVEADRNRGRFTGIARQAAEATQLEPNHTGFVCLALRKSCTAIWADIWLEDRRTFAVPGKRRPAIGPVSRRGPFSNYSGTRVSVFGSDDTGPCP